MAFGGVATGSMNAHEAEIVAGIINKRGCIPMPAAVLASTGMKRLVVAMLDVSSVVKVKVVHVNEIMIGSGTLPNKDSCVPNHSAKPLLLNPPASAIPPPNRIKMPHGILTADS